MNYFSHMEGISHWKWIPVQMRKIVQIFVQRERAQCLCRGQCLFSHHSEDQLDPMPNNIIVYYIFVLIMK